MIRLQDIYENDQWLNFAYGFLYTSLELRQAYENISHKKMPGLEAHMAHIDGRPHRGWWLIMPQDDLGGIAGHCYLSKQNEIGIWLHPSDRRKGYGGAVLKQLLEMFPGERLLANIAPENEASLRFFRNFGFKMIQVTYELDRRNKDII